jgi:acetaldehyde dehydrogenase/alcohol dehydrogenase
MHMCFVFLLLQSHSYTFYLYRYKSGKPAIGVGGGNAPVLIDERADLQTACGSLVLGKTFDNGVICAAEQSAVVVDEAYDKFKELLQARGVFFLEGQERERLAAFIHKDGRINPDIVGQTALEIAKLAGLKGEIPPHTVVLATEETEIGPHNPLSAEKLSPVLSLFRAKDFEDGLQLCRALALHGGIGHTGGFYTDDEGGSSARVEAYVKCVPVGRVIVNAPTSLTAIGTAFNFAVDPSFTLGVGTHAGSSVSAALTPTHLLNTVIAAERQKHMEWFNLPRRIFFNRGCLEEALQSCAGPDENGLCTTRAIVVTDPGMVQCGHVDRLVDALKKIGHTVDVFSAVSPDPDMACIRRGVKACESFRPDIMFCLGGGSPIDAGKFIRVQYEHPDLTVDQAATRFIELRKRTNPFPKMGSMIRKLIAIPTTSGTGSEVSPFTVITGDDGMKYPIASYHLTPDMAICDSTFCDGLPQGLIANAGIDAVTHAIEAYVSVAQNDFTKQHCIEALKLLFANLPTSYNVGTPKSRDRVHRGATIAGIAFSNSFLGVCHSLAHKVGAHFHLPHGMTNSILLPHVIRYNATDTPTRMGVYPSYNYPKAVKRYGELAQAVGASSNTAEGLIEELKKLSQALHLPQSFKEAGVSKEEYVAALDEIAEDAFDDQCTPCNPRFPLIPELKEVLMNAYE